MNIASKQVLEWGESSASDSIALNSLPVIFPLNNNTAKAKISFHAFEAHKKDFPWCFLDEDDEKKFTSCASLLELSDFKKPASSSHLWMLRELLRLFLLALIINRFLFLAMPRFSVAFVILSSNNGYKISLLCRCCFVVEKEKRERKFLRFQVERGAKRKPEKFVFRNCFYARYNHIEWQQNGMFVYLIRQNSLRFLIPNLSF